MDLVKLPLLMQLFGAGARDSAFLTSFQVMLMLLVFQSHLEWQVFKNEVCFVSSLLKLGGNKKPWSKPSPCFFHVGDEDGVFFFSSPLSYPDISENPSGGIYFALVSKNGVI